MAIINYGRIDKKLIFIIFIVIEQTIDMIVYSNVPEEYSNDIMCSLEEEIGPIIFGTILYFIFRFKQKRNSKNKKNYKYLIYLFLLRTIKSCYERLYPYFIKEQKYRYRALLNTVNGVEIILMTIGTLLLLKYKYYIHHIISMVIYCALGICSDFILGNFLILNYKYIFIYIIYIINEVSIFCYLKYMMDKLYYQYYEVVIYWGIIGLLVKLIIFSSLSIHEYKNEIEGIINDIQQYFAETNIYIIIFYQYFYYLFYQGSYYLLVVLMLYYLKPNHMIITDELNVYENLIFFDEQPNKFYTLIPFVFQILSLLFYFEILELNFCNLDKNTVKNIQIRESKETCSRNSVSSTIELGEGHYIIYDNESKKSEDDIIDNNNIKQNDLLIPSKNMDKNNDSIDEFEIIYNKW